MTLNRMHTSRRAVLKTATTLLAASVTSAVTEVSRQSTRAAAVVPAFGRAEFVPNSRVDPRDYLSAGETWTSVACIRPAMQAALDEAHGRAISDPSAVVEVVIPPGVGKLTTQSRRAPINRSSQLSPRGIYDTRIGFALRANIKGKLLIRGSGGQSRASVIRLSDNARNLFYLDTDTGISWIDTTAVEPSGLRSQRPSKPLMLRNVTFQGFAVDNNNTVGSCHIVCGTVPSATMPQRYVSIQNVHALDIDVWGMVQVVSNEDQATRNKAPFVFTARHFSDYESNGGPGHGTADGHAWRGWDLSTIEGRRAAHKAGWTWMNEMSFERVRATNTTRGIIVVGEPHQHFSHWVDAITMTACEHRQDRPFTEGTVGQTSFFVGGSCQGGSATLTDCVTVNVGDDGVEIGGMQNVRITRLKCVNACLAGIYLMYPQRPLDWSTTKIIVEDSTFMVDGAAIQKTQSAYFRSVPIDVKFHQDAADVALGALEVNRCTTIIDGVDPSGRFAAKGVLDKMIRKQRYGWFLVGPVVKATYTSCRAILRNVQLQSDTPTRVYLTIMWHSQQKVPSALGASPSVTIADCTAEVAGIRSNGAQGEFVGVAAHSMGSASTSRLTVTMSDCGSVFSRADLARVGWLHPDMTAVTSPRQVIQAISGTMTTSPTKTRKAVVKYAEQKVTASEVTNVTYVPWGAPKAVETSA